MELQLMIVEKKKLWYDVNSFVLVFLMLIIGALQIFLLRLFEIDIFISALSIIILVVGVFKSLIHNFYNMVKNFTELGTLIISERGIESSINPGLITLTEDIVKINFEYSGQRGKTLGNRLPIKDGINSLNISTKTFNWSARILLFPEDALTLIAIFKEWESKGIEVESKLGKYPYF
ncbi:hypothetical protein GC194_10810 [bacterium]|nr:hypothetical protein [bacterium]